MHSRASQFMPFDALNGFKETLKEVEKIKEEKKILSDDIFQNLNLQIKALNKNDKVKINYYYEFEYTIIIDVIKKIDLVNKILYLTNSKILFDDIIKIEKLNY